MMSIVYRLWLAADRASSKIVDLLENDPTSWKITNYEIIHKSGLRIWHCNSVYGLKVYTDEEGWRGNHWVPCRPERVLIYRALTTNIRRVRRAQERVLRKTIEAAIDAASSKNEATP